MVIVENERAIRLGWPLRLAGTDIAENLIIRTDLKSSFSLAKQAVTEEMKSSIGHRLKRFDKMRTEQIANDILKE